MSAEVEEGIKSVSLETWDIVVICVYFGSIFAVAIWSSCRNRGSAQGYFLAGRSMVFITVGASLFASNIGSGHFVGLAGSGAAGGIGIAVFELNAIFILMFLGWVFLPVYIAAGVYTMPEYLRKRFGGQRIRTYLAVLALILYIFTKISADLYSGAIFLKQAINLDIWWSAVALLVVAMLFAILGGLTAVMWTDFVQTVIMIGGAFVLMGISIAEVSNKTAENNHTTTFDAVVEEYFAAVDPAALQSNSNCGMPPPDSMKFFRSLDWTNDLPWIGTFFGSVISSVWYWCSDQVIVQRALAAKNLSHARAGTLIAGCLKFMPLFIMVLPGMMSRILYPGVIGCVDPKECERLCGSQAGCTNSAYPLLVIRLMPEGARGLLLTVMVSALISSLASVLNSSSTIFTMDIWKRARRHATDTELLMVGRVFVLGMVGLSMAWIPIVQSFSELFQYIQQITSYLAPPICAVYMMAIFVKRVNEQGAFWGLMAGLVTGGARFGWELSYSKPLCGELDERPDIIRKVHYLHFGMLLFGIVCMVTVVVSLLTRPIDSRRLVRLTYFGRFDEGVREDISIAEEKADADDDDEDEDGEKMGTRGAQAKEKEASSLAAVYTNGAYVHENGSNEAVADSGVQETTFNAQRPRKATKKGGKKAKKADPDAEPTFLKKVFSWVCGIESSPKEAVVIPEEVLKAQLAQSMSITEAPVYRKLNNFFAVVVMVMATFLWGFFA